MVEDEVFRLSQGDFLMIPPQYMHSSKVRESAVKKTLMFDQKFICSNIPEDLLRKIQINSTKILSVDDYRHYCILREDFLQVFNHFSENTVEEKLKLQSCIFQFLATMVRWFVKEQEIYQIPVKKTGTDLLFEQISAYIFRNYTENLKLKDIAAEFSITSQYVELLIKKYRSMSFLDFLNEIRLSHASYELSHTDKKVTEIMYDSGFGSSKAFNRFFQKKYNLSPKQFQIEHRSRKREVISR